ncbi:MAG: pyrroline-5-carboxylate reductase [Spirochaetaceae bacterium]|jgi:pyrroline-5-carboxylate reductase|nr:pyrroline-5-carboxylate reductase [Spirochaetaceae bacterium]
MNTLDTLTVGFIGVGMMGGALLQAASRAIPGDRIIVSDKDPEKTAAAARQTGCAAAPSNLETARKSHVLFLAVKPAQIPQTLAEIRGEIPGKILVSIAAGVSLERLRDYGAPSEPKAFIRLMPNLPATIGEGMIALSSLGAGRDSVDTVKALLAGAGVVEEVDEHLMDCVTAVSGSGPAYAFMFIEALADAAVLLGMGRKQAYVYAAQTLRGAAGMALQSGRHPGDLKDAVCSPSGTTIEAVRVLEARGFRSAVIEAAIGSAKKSMEMGKK